MLFLAVDLLFGEKLSFVQALRRRGEKFPDQKPENTFFSLSLPIDIIIAVNWRRSERKKSDASLHQETRRDFGLSNRNSEQ